MATTPRRGLAIGILLFASFMDLLDVTIVQVALPSIGADLGASEAQLEWIVSGYMLAFAVALITGGRLGDLFGRRRVFLIGIAGFTLASAAAAAAWSGEALVATRIAQGLFAALMVPQLLASVQALFSPRERAPMYGLIGGVSGLAAVLGPVLGGWLIDADLWGLGWRAVFLINIPVGIAIFALAARFVPETRSSRPMRLDLVGVALLTAIVLAFMVPLVEGQSLGWPAWLWIPVAIGAVLLVVFIAYSRRRMRRDGSALLPMPLFADRGFSAGIVTQAAFQGSLNAFTLPFIIYLQVGLGFDALTAGLNLLAFSLGALVGTAAVIPLVARVGKVPRHGGRGAPRRRPAVGLRRRRRDRRRVQRLGGRVADAALGRRPRARGHPARRRRTRDRAGRRRGRGLRRLQHVPAARRRGRRRRLDDRVLHRRRRRLEPRAPGHRPAGLRVGRGRRIRDRRPREPAPARARARCRRTSRRPAASPRPTPTSRWTPTPSAGTRAGSPNTAERAAIG